MDEKIQKVIRLIEASELDQTIKDILIRDITNDGLNDFNREQIKAYCLEGIKKIDAEIEEAKRILNEMSTQTPA